MKKYFLVIILIIAAVTRLYNLNHHMDTLYGDEVAIGYNAFAITQTLRDEYGRFLPLQFESWGDQKNPVYIYATALVQLLTGPTIASVRIPSALAGILAVYLTYRLVVLIGLGEATAIVSAFLLSVTPWHVHLSRGGYEANLALTLTLASIVLLLSKRFTWSVILLVLSVYTYYTTKMFAPLILLFSWIYLVQGDYQKHLKPFIKYWALTFILVIPIIYLALFKGGQVRFQNINIFADKTITARVERGRNFFDNPKSILAKLSENRLTYNLEDFITYYFDNFSGQFLFVSGDSNLRYGLSNHGMLYLLDAPLLLLGILLLYKHKHKTWVYLIAYLLLAPIPTSLVGRAYGLRSLAMLPIPQIFAAYSVVYLYTHSGSQIFKKLLFLGGFILYFVSISNWFLRYAYQYPSYGRYWYDAPMQDAVTFAKSLENDYNHIIISQSYGEVSMYYAFFNRIDPSTYRQAKQNRVTLDGVPMIQLGKYYFGDIRPTGPIENMQIPYNSLIIVQPLFEYGEGTITARDDGRAIYRYFGFPTVHMKAKGL